MPINQDRAAWYAFSYRPELDSLSWQQPVVIGQIHSSHMQPITAPPPLGIVVRDGQMRVVLHSSERSAAEIDKNENRKLQQISVAAGALVPGQWTCVVIRAVWSSVPGTGELAVWRDQQLVLQIRNSANAYPTPLGVYPKVGLYAYDGMQQDQITMDADVVRIFGKDATLDKVRAQARCARP